MLLNFFAGYVIFLFVASVHECAHAWTADRCGDPTARLQGRVTLDPRAHIDLIGTVLIPLSPLIFFLVGMGGFPGGFGFFGWAKPVPVNPGRVRNWRRDNMLVSFAGCASGFLVALAAALLLRVLTRSFPGAGITGGVLAETLLRLGSVSIFLSLFNLVPIPPLDGYHILTDLLRVDPGKSAAFLRASGPWLILLVINTPFLFGILEAGFAAVWQGLFLPLAGI
ncbi:MAG: site-2 protease family protein [Chlamydiota bacterium]